MDSVNDVDEGDPRLSATTTAPEAGHRAARHFLADRRSRRKVLTYSLVALFPLAVIAAVATLAVMVGSAAAATGGCGGG
jgi:hypothetical protein